MRNTTTRWMLTFAGLASFAALPAQITFSNQNALLHDDAGTAGSNANNRSGNAVCVIDVDNNGLDDIVKLDNNRYVRIEYQTSSGVFSYQYIGDFGTSSSNWGMSCADVDHNGYKDVLFCGGSQAKLMKLNNTGTGVLGSIINLPNGNIFCQNGNFMDVNNDGWEDIFMCNDVNESRIWVNDQTGNFPAEAGNTVINFDINPGTAAPNDESGNYGSVWSDFDNDGDVDFYIIHCRQGQPAGDIRRTNVLFLNNGNGTYTSAASTYNLASNDQDWTGSFGDIDNDGDFDLFLTKHNTTSAFYLNDGSGHFGTSAGTIAFGNMPMQSQFEDFDNDGYVDLLITGDNDHRLYRNNGNNTFTNVTPAGWTVSGTNILSFASGDLNHDGKIDIYTSYGGTYNSPSGSIDDRLWMNTTSNSNHYITFILNGTVATHGALGARVFIYGPWGVQTREVRASESYGTSNSMHLHFGLGSATNIDSVRVNWPSGNTDLILNQPADVFVTLTEQQCTLSAPAITYSGSTTFCSTDSLQLTAPSGSYTYLWSTGETTQSIYANASGNYSVTVYQSLTCFANSSPVTLTVDPVETPTINATGDTEFCPGGSVDITSSSAPSYQWSSGETTQTITATASGDYFVTIQGLCDQFNSDTITVTVLDNTAPTGSDVYLTLPASTMLTATGTNVSWYDAASGGTLLGTGNNYTTPVVSVNTTYYAEDQHEYGGSTGNVGQVNHSGTDFSGTTFNGYQVFDVTGNCTLNQVKVYTDTPGNRTIQLRNSSGTVVQSATVNIPADTSWVTLNWALTPGTGYILGTDTASNVTNFGFNSPQLMRSTSGVSYPYTMNNAVTITGSSAGGTLYYYFYDWQVTIPPSDVCVSARTPITVFVTSGAGIDPVGEHQISVYPNPATDMVNIQFTTDATSHAMLSLHDLMGRNVLNMNLGEVNGTQIQQVPLRGLAAGVYKLGLTINDKTYNSLIVVK